MSNFFQRLFPRRVHYKTKLAIQDYPLEEIIQQNREKLNEVKDWFDEEAMQSSCFQYGVPDFIRDSINKPLNNDLTYTDLMAALARKYFPDHIDFLEIGVSVGKNFYQVLHSVSKGNFTGFDIEEINPVLERKLSFRSKETWSTPASSIKKNDSSKKAYFFNENPVQYIAGDVWDENCWKKLEGRKYNLIFSDALHSPEAILFEFEMIVKYNLLGDRFIIFWDDLHGKMKRAFLNIVRKYNKNYHLEDVFLIQINGWIGQHEAKHPVGIISNFSL